RLLLDMVFLAIQIDRWLEGAAAAGEPSRRLLDQAIAEDLRPSLRRLLGAAAAFQRAGRLPPELWPVPRIDPVAILDAQEEEWAPGPPDLPCSEASLDRLLDVIEAFLDGLFALASKAAGGIEPSLGTAAHPPHMALMLAFLRVFGGARDDLNRLPPAIMEFYQESVLRERPRKAQPDRMFLSFAPVPAPTASLPEIAAGTLFPAGQDAGGSDIAFAAGDRLTVTGAVPIELRLWRSEEDGHGGRRVLSEAIPVSPDGAVGARLFDVPDLPPAAAGLIIASPLLELASGRRTVTLRFGDLDLPFGLDDQRLARLLKNAFAVETSSAAGWLRVPIVETRDSWVQGAKGEAVFCFTLTAGDGALAPLPGAAVPALPAIRLSLQQEEVDGPSPLKWLGAATFGSLAIEVAVEKLGGLSVTTASGGPGPVTAGMSAFGAPPTPGDRLRIDHPAFAVGQLDRVKLGLSWLGLPPDADGFLGYYRQYVVGPDRSIWPSCLPLFTNES
ncbi:hypothetical protein, partial [Allosphingosinicella sp.]|uniref:hypothetical protein n=1 Tax=Allosphingosinicella sp. TaxID=2823234 RepID=UPI002F176D38